MVLIVGSLLRVYIWLMFYCGYVKYLDVMLRLYVWLMQVRTMAITDILAQASLSRLGENSRSWPKFLLELSLRRKAFVLSDEISRSIERVSPKRELMGAYCGSLGCGPGERPHLWAKSSLAQARRSRPSENSRTLLCFLLAVSPKRGLVA
ncbi:hypothetical protein DEO72_LG6g1561 [Vigna unguiculata]|uniref:Uncharacterized protein n=1 Tax=Vigna unguiculata TaxID=3917 RepID=A0A4D6M8X9_VIGUN|nr:hypothetical protein DEO72_LG3g1241 [Vigna unguiculata]QCD96851.1 hypothetical protein DEO72_LG6g1561 [Vigna unguiculata]